ncbi:MAG: hypothetical protein LBR48_01725 [Dysgonamonadaceae bacterium]|jgi:hypothetical protein|nr:hypothetical protein [Dysgonamonadaceae bacterium]
MNSPFSKITTYRRMLFCSLACTLICGLTSCADEVQDNATLSAPGSITFSVGGIAKGGAEALTRAQMQPQTVTQDLGDGLSLVYTLAPDPVAATRADNTSPMEKDTKFRVIVYKADGTHVYEGVFEAEKAATISGLENGQYKMVAISYNSKTEAPQEVGSSATAITVDPSNDLLYWTGDVNLTPAPTPDVSITFKHCFTRVTVRISSFLTGNSITSVPTSATLNPGYRGELNLNTGAITPTDTILSQTFTFGAPTDTVATSTTSRCVFTGNKKPSLKFIGTLRVDAPSGEKTVTDPLVSFSTALLIGYSYTLTMRVEASRGDYYPFTENTGDEYECTIPLGSSTAYAYTDKNGKSQTVGELTFLTYNLGADPKLSPKEQMAYPHSDDKNIRVYGGLWQWGRKDVEHSLRDSVVEAPNFFTTDLYTKSDSPTKFVYGISYSNPANWTSDHTINSNLWGNGLGIPKQTDFRSSTSSGTDFNGSSNVANNLKNPCPNGYRVPTQHEWALILNENGLSNSIKGDLFYTNGDNDNLSSYSDTWYVPKNNANVVWVRVSDKKAATSFTSGKMNGYAIYDARNTAINTVDKRNTVFAEGADLTADSAPMPLMFLPAAGLRECEKGIVDDTGIQGYYWSSTLGGNNTTIDIYSCQMVFSGTIVRADTHFYRAFGHSVRCVKKLSGEN